MSLQGNSDTISAPLGAQLTLCWTQQGEKMGRWPPDHCLETPAGLPGGILDWRDFSCVTTQKVPSGSSTLILH